MLSLKEIERTCTFCGKVFRQNFNEILKCLCSDCRRGRKIKPETIDEHIEEEKRKNVVFKEAFEEEKKLLGEGGEKWDKS